MMRCLDGDILILEEVAAIKIAPFNRYQTLDVVRAVVERGRARDIALYTENDDNIIVDLLTEFRFASGSIQISGGLLGQWAVWTRRFRIGRIDRRERRAVRRPKLLRAACRLARDSPG